MVPPLPQVLQVSLLQQGLFVSDEQGGWLALSHAGGEPVTVLAGYEAGLCLRTADGGLLVPVLCDKGGGDIWVFEAQGLFLGALTDTSSKSSGFHTAVTNLATAYVHDLRSRGLGPAHDPFWRLLERLDDVYLIRLAQLAGTPELVSLINDEPLHLATAYGVVDVAVSSVRRVLQMPSPTQERLSRPWLELAAEAGRLLVPALAQDGHADRVSLIGRWEFTPIYLCHEHSPGLDYVIIQRPGGATVLYFPADARFVAESPLDEVDLKEAAWRLDQHLIALAREDVAFTHDSRKGVGLFAFGIAHLAHAIWDEMSALDTFLSKLGDGGRLPWLYIVEGRTGVEIYGPAETLYPELAGRVVRNRTDAAAYASAIRAGVELVLVSGHAVLKSSRARILAQIDQDRHAPGIQAQGRRDGLTIALSLRLSNRCPEDALGVYVRLSRSLVQQFGPITVVLDGFNKARDGGSPAGPLFNGNRGGSASSELERERAWAARFAKALKRDKVFVVSCVGATITENLFWLARCHVFIASFGAGLAKLRWVLDKPGFVLVSQANREHFGVLDLFMDPQVMEGEFTPLYFNDMEDVVDLPLDPPRVGPTPWAVGIPHPDDFRVDEVRTFPKIHRMVAEHFHRDMKNKSWFSRRLAQFSAYQKRL